MPVYNEAGCIRNVICDWLHALRELKIDFNLLVIDDGSTDETPAVLQELSAQEPELNVLRQANAGHGAAVLAGYRQAESDWVFQTDSDGELRATDFEKLWSHKDDVDGVRGLRPAKAGAAYRNVLRKMEPLPVALLFGRWHRDLNIPFRLYRREALQRMLEVLPKAPFAPNALLTALAPTRGLHIRTVEIGYAGRAAGTSKLKWFALSKACVNVVFDLLQARLRSF
jgi:glycosyltransferase involved in cell wall biosynthesis